MIDDTHADENSRFKAFNGIVGDLCGRLDHPGRRVVAGGKRLPAWKWMGVTAVTGLAIGFFSAILTLVFMAVKTGLHAHGPEFRPQEISWLIQQIPFWTTGGFLAGLGVGLIRTGTSDQ
jgi:hypothetical protein